MKKKNLFHNIWMVICLFILLLLSLNSASAITGKIGNGRMVLNLDSGEEIERSIQVINDNNVSLNITLFTGGNLTENIELVDENFILNPGEEKRAGFILRAPEKIGRYEGRINVKFAPEDKNEAGVI